MLQCREKGAMLQCREKGAPPAAHVSCPFCGAPAGMFNAAGVYSTYTQLGLTIREMVVVNGGGHSLGG